MAPVDPVPDEPAATVDLDDERALVIADYHAGIEAALRGDGVEIDSNAAARRKRLRAILDRTDPDRVIFLGDLTHGIGEPGGDEQEELRELLSAVPDAVSIIVVKGNHDGDIETAIDAEVTGGRGTRIGDVGFAHGHTWPAPAVLDADVVCVGHEHPQVRLEDAVGGCRIERAWLRGDLAADAFEKHADDVEADGGTVAGIDGELVVFPAFNEVAGGTWINVAGQSFLAPFLPGGLADGQAYLLDGTRLGAYQRVS
ncbi:MAG: metallophosphoesterase [Halobacteriales archaeon]